MPKKRTEIIRLAFGARDIGSGAEVDAMGNSALDRARYCGAGALAAIGIIHANWATGSAWPAPDRTALARAVLGAERVPPAAPCLAVAALLGIAAAFVGGLPRRAPRIRTIGATGVATVLALRAAIGFSGRMPHSRRSDVFARWNLRLYSPLCLALAILAACGALAPAADP